MGSVAAVKEANAVAFSPGDQPMSGQTHRARDHMADMGRRVPDLWSLVDEVRSANSEHIGGPDWPDHCYLPLEHAGLIAASVLQSEGAKVTATTAAQLGSSIAAFSAWRMTQGIYRYDPTLFAALIDTPIEGEIPAAIIQRLPEWCVYVETPGLVVPTSTGELALQGAFAWLDRPRGGSHDVLTLLLDADGARLSVTHVPLIGTMTDALQRVVEDWREAFHRGNARTAPPERFAVLARKTLAPIVSLVMYLCVEGSDITGRRGRPENPAPVRTRRKGIRLFAVSEPTTWDVGVRIGAALRQAYDRNRNETALEPTGRELRPHIRRAHWHTFVHGPRQIPEQQRRCLKWLPPVAVNITDYDTLPSVIKKVPQGSPNESANGSASDD